jgi:phosphonate transport system substrate-binding protein
MQKRRYANRPIYYSDVIVLRESRHSTFEDLRGGSWAFNEPGSHSGYNLVRYHLAKLGNFQGYFSRVLEAGSHQEALDLVLRGRVDAAAIDSTVLELEMRRRPEIEARLRIVDVMGPSPIPPWIIAKRMPKRLRRAIRNILLQMNSDALGRAILDSGLISHFSRIKDRDYDVIRKMTRKGSRVELAPLFKPADSLRS